MISERLGHSKFGFTLDTYIHLLPSQQEEAAGKIETAMNAAFDRTHTSMRVS
jgi:hypothetical protein